MWHVYVRVASKPPSTSCKSSHTSEREGECVTGGEERGREGDRERETER
jgi:hypothetical protein